MINKYDKYFNIYFRRYIWKPYGEMKYCCQWYKSNFSIPKTGRTFICMEQYMMYQNAILFGDNELTKIMIKEQMKLQSDRIKNKY